MSQAYYGVFWASNLRIEKASNPREACAKAFGLCVDSMRVKLLTTRKADLRSNKWKAANLGSLKKWLPVCP